MRERSWLEDAVPFAAMLTVQCTDIGLTTLSKAAMSRGMSPFVYVVYYNALGTIFLFPSFIFYSKNSPPLTFHFLSRFFLLGLIGICFGEIIGFIGIGYSSPTLSSAMGNLIPAFTFVLAVVFRMEKIDWRSSSTQAKSLGTLVSISGAIIVTLYKGPPIIIIPSSPSNLTHHLLFSSQSNWVLGGVLLACTCFLASIWNILLAATAKEYPSKITIVFFYCFFGTIQCTVFSLIEVRDPSAWRLKPDMEPIAIVYAAVFGSVIRTHIHTWGMHKKGPVYVAMFRPLGIIIAVFLGVTFLGDTLHVGSIVGAIILALGFYAVMWGKAKEEKMDEEDIGISSIGSSTPKAPLLQNQDVL